MALITVVVCDVCNSDQEFDAAELDDDSESAAILGSEEHAESMGWIVDGDDGDGEGCRHVCPDCQATE